MQHLKALLTKFIVWTIALWFILGVFFNVDFGDIVTISIILTLVSYAVGDLWILRRFGNATATVADFVLAYIGIWLIGGAIIEENISLGWASFISAVVLAVAEIFIHRYMVNNVFTDEDYTYADRKISNKPAYQTEFAEEQDIRAKNRNEE
ncbi:hypothetical protein J2S13_002664 [Oikeobacillus pervagus]|uniref:DUF2512 family protein n=1 Tax=Oikeobacillus pervagus TaxID=1325931 RepID=A0AAJ1T0W2_9BACI|nr:YndM family protein [Oikeobacillus pervagus]MDQ0216224.1 hypothetical protein [Oikeobacillus pervagus]